MKLYRRTVEAPQLTRNKEWCYEEVDPADLEHFLRQYELGYYGLVQKIKGWLQEKAPRIKSPSGEVRTLNVDSFERAIADLESDLESALDA